LSEATIEKFIESGFLDKYTDIFALDRFKDEITAMDGFGEKSYTKLIAAIDKAKNVRLPNFIYALGINHVGLSNAKLLCSYYNNDLNKIMAAKAEELVEIEGFGDIIAQAIERYFSYRENTELIDKVMEYLTIEQPEEISEALKFEGMSFVVTGDVYTYKNRKELQADIERLGGKVTGSVSSKTNYLINNDINSSSSKNKKAKELEIPIITEQQFIDMLGND
jgi:DNA ligase (NAD+)